jgi:uncharacterized membrane protein
MIKKLRHYFATGILVSLPVFITVYLICAIFRFIDGIFGKGTNFLLKKYLGFSVPGIGIILGILVVFVIGFFAANFFGRRLFKALEGWFLKFPFIRQIYPAAKQIVDSFISKEGPAFKKVAMVEYPSKGIWSIGFITNDSFREANEAASADLVHVLIATTPSPLTGFLILVPRKDIKVLDISVEDGIKLIISAGILKPGI